MRHIRPRWIETEGITGEFLPSDYGVFLNIEELAHVSRFWDALVNHALAVDEASSRLAQRTTPTDPKDAENDAWAQEQQEKAADSHFYLTRASILSLIAGFVEFCLLEAYELVFESYPTKDRPDIMRDVIHPLESKIGTIKLPDLYKTTVLESRDSIRNALQHGRWMGLKDASEKIDIHDAFLGVVSYTYELETSLRNAGTIK